MTPREAADKMGENFLKWAEARRRGDYEEADGFIVETVRLATECDDPGEALKLHFADKVKLTAINNQRRGNQFKSAHTNLD